MKKLIIIASTCLLGLGMFFLTGCHKDEIEDGKGQMYNEVKIDTNEGKSVDYKAESCHTNWNVYKKGEQGAVPPEGYSNNMKDGQFCIWDHSGTAVGYYGSKADYQAVENKLKEDVQESHYGSDGDCVVIFKENSIKSIDVVE